MSPGTELLQIYLPLLGRMILLSKKPGAHVRRAGNDHES